MLRTALSVLIVISAALAIRAEYLGPRTLVYVFKPLTTVLILGMAALLGPGPARIYRVAILLGLGFSLAGDVFLMLPQDRFIAGLISFLIAHLCYLAAFTSGRTLSGSRWVLIGLLAYGALAYLYLLPGLEDLRLPVLIYILVILMMAWQAWSRYGFSGERASLLAAAGATLFMISDSLLAVDKFRLDFASSRALILSTYWLAQWLIAASLG